MKAAAAEWTTFRMPLWQWHLFTIAVGQLAIVPLSVVLFAVLEGPEAVGTERGVAFVGAGSSCIPVPLILAVTFYLQIFRYRVGPAGLRGYDRWGRPVAMTWGAIHTARRVDIPLVPFLRVGSTDTTRTLWLPLYLVGFDRFAGLVAEYAGEDHPVTLELLSHLEADT
jgi:hypothetical protein